VFFFLLLLIIGPLGANMCTDSLLKSTQIYHEHSKLSLRRQ